MLSAEHIEQFDRNGFIIVPNVLTSEQMLRLRADLTRLFDERPLAIGDNQSIRVDIFSRYPEFRWLLSHPPIVQTLRSLLGDDFVYFPESAAQDSSFGSWHKDTTTGEQAGYDFHLAPDFRMVQAVLYCQDNGTHGGGLDVIPGSHRQSDPYVKRQILGPLRWKVKQLGLRTTIALRSLLRPLKRRLRPASISRDLERVLVPFRNTPAPSGAISVPSKAGDLVLFHLRLNHKATWPQRDFVPIDHRKLGIFYVCSANNAHVEAYKRFLLRRAEYGYMRGFHYPADFLQLAREHNLRLG